MRKFWLVVKQEYRIRALKRSFILGTLVVPFIIAIFFLVIILVAARQLDNRPFGYVDYSGALEHAKMPKDDEEMVEIIAYSSEESARNALDEGEIQGYHVLPEDYLDSLFVDLYYLDETPANRVLRDFDDYVRTNILDGSPSATQIRIMEGTTLTIRSITENRQFQANEEGIIIVMLPILIAMFFLFAVMGAAGYFLQIITDEKENRTMEIMVTTISPVQLIGGKSVGLVFVGLTQLGIWLSSIVIAWIAARQVFDNLEPIQLPWDVLIIFAIFFLPSYSIIAGMMICIGSTVTELQEGQQISGVINMLFLFPIFFSALVFADPNSPLLVFLSFWPTTSLMSIIMRWGFTVIPVWQIAISWVISVVSGIIIVWIASRLFRLGMLRYGQRITLKAALAALRPANQN